MDLKFRAYIKTVKWMLPVERINFDIGNIEVDLTGGNGDIAEYDFDEVELMQYTGLKDRKGKEIYSGDILLNAITESDGEVLTDIGIVKASSHSGMWIVENTDGKFQDPLWEWVSENIEVVGNVWESQEFMDGNDCIWINIIGCEEGCKCCGYRSSDSDEGRRIMQIYQDQVGEALQPLKEKWESLFDSGDWTELEDEGDRC